MALVFIRSVCFATKAFNSSLFAKSAAKDSLICAFRSRLSSDWLSLYAFSKRSLRVSGGDSFVGDYCSVVLTTRLVEYSKKSQKYLTNKCSYVIIQARKFACKGFRAQYFNGNGDLTMAKRGNDSCRQNLILSRFYVII